MKNCEFKEVSEMEISSEKAQESLTEIQATTRTVTKSLGAAYASSILILWGVIIVLGFLGTHLLISPELERWIWYLWMSLVGMGSISTFLICWRQYKKGVPIKNPALAKAGWRDLTFWLLLFAYLGIWLRLVNHWEGVQFNAFICTVIMFAYVMMGLYEPGARFLLWLGLGATALILIGYYLIPRDYYYLWMAPAFGGALLGTGVYLRYRYK